MRELTLNEMEEVSGGFDGEIFMTGLGFSVVGALGAAAGLALAISPAGLLGFAVYGSAAVLGVGGGAVMSISSSIDENIEVNENSE